MENAALRLEYRTGLPDALRVLVETYPRAGWTQDPGFDELIRFWLDRHLMFRRLLSDMTQTTRNLLDHKMEAQSFGGRLSRLGGMFVNGLHEHHTVEDHVYFPKLAQKDARLTRGFAILDADHVALDAHLSSFVETANAALTRLQDRTALQDASGLMLSDIERLTGLLDRHLTDEEDLIVPIILKFGAD